MKILVIGSGGREHAIAWKLAQSKNVEKIFAAPGNGGTAEEEKTENIPLHGIDPASRDGQDFLLRFARENAVDLTVVGPEAVLAAGINEKFQAAGLAIVGPGEKAARLESSKIYAKSFMEKYHIPTAKSRKFTSLPDAVDYTERHFYKTNKKSKNPVEVPSGAPPLVIKADGLAAGKGVVIAKDADEAKDTLRSFMKDGSLGEAGKSLIIEDYLEGFEASILAAVNIIPGKKGVIIPFLPARDHKSLNEGGKGPNTGGMGVIAPLPEFNSYIGKEFVNNVLNPTIKGMMTEKMEYRGFIFFGLMVCQERVYLLEYNVRLGDPETQALLPLMDSDFAELCMAIAGGNLSGYSIKWKDGAVCAPVAVAEGYPGTYRRGDPIAINPAGLERTGAKIFAAGAERGTGGYSGSGMRTNGGRVLTVSAYGSDADDACRKAYDALRCVGFEGMFFRKDIGRPMSDIGQDDK